MMCLFRRHKENFSMLCWPLRHAQWHARWPATATLPWYEDTEEEEEEEDEDEEEKHRREQSGEEGQHKHGGKEDEREEKQDESGGGEEEGAEMENDGVQPQTSK